MKTIMIRKTFELRIFFILFWFYSFRGFIFAEIIHDSSLKSISFAVADLVLFFISFSHLKNKINQKYLIYLFIFLFSATITFIINDVSIFQQINGLRGYLYLPSFFILLEYLFKNIKLEILENIFRKNFIYWTILQIPLCLYQYMYQQYQDSIGGGFTYGGSGLLTLILFLIVFFLIYSDYKKKKYLIVLDRRNFKYLILFFPLFINETMISYILLPLMTFFMLNFRKSFIKNIMIVGLFILILFTYRFVYIRTLNYKGTSISRAESIFTKKYFSDYLLKEGDANSNRFSRTIYNFRNSLGEKEHLMFGRGYGIFRGSFIGESSYRKDNLDLFGRSGFTSFLSLAMQGGLIAVIIFGGFINYMLFPVFFVRKKEVKKYFFFVLIISLVPWIYSQVYSNAVFVAMLTFSIVYLKTIGKKINI